MTEIVDFQEIVERYANQIARERNTRVGWVCLDGSRPELRNYPSRKLSYTVGNPRFDWGDPSLRQSPPVSQTFPNNSSQTITTAIEWNQKIKDVFKNSITTGIKLGASVEANFGIKLAGGKVTKSFEFNLSYTHAWENEVETTWKVSQSIPQAPRTLTEVEWSLDQESTKGRFRVNIAISGAVAIWFRDQIEWFDGTNRHNLWFPSPGMIVRDLRPEGFEADGFRANFRSTGTVDAEVGIRSRLSVKDWPLTASGAVAASSLAAVEYVLDPDGRILREERQAALEGVSALGAI
jgi:hypothetical protein